MKAAVPLAKNVLAPSGITAAASVINVGIHQKIHGSGTTTLMILKNGQHKMKQRGDYLLGTWHLPCWEIC